MARRSTTFNAAMEEQEEYDEDVEVIEEDLFHQQVGRKLFIVFQASIGAQCGF